MKSNINLYLILIIIVALVFSFLTIYAFGNQASKDLPLSARSAALYQPETDNFLFSKNADVRMPMASTTKIMTALVTLERAKLNDLVVIDEAAVGIEGSSAYLKAGEVLSVEELLYALLLQSANDAATAIAYHICDGVDAFADIMNQKANELGLKNTHFTNPHGLDDKEHYTTAKDLAVITAEAMKNECFRNITSTYKKTFATEERTRTYVNHNKMLLKYDGCIGVKTGFTKKSGRCLVTAAEREGLEFISVTLDAPNDWNDHAKMLDLGYSKLERLELLKENEYCYKIPIINGNKDNVTVANLSPLSIIRGKDEGHLDKYIKLSRYRVAPIKEGDVLGEIIFTVDGKEIGRQSLVATESISAKSSKGLFDRLISLFD